MQLQFLTRVIVLVSLLVAVYGIGQQFLKFPVISTNNSEFSKGLALTLGPGARINSTFAGHYDLAAYSIFPLVLIIGLIMIPGKHKLLIIGIGGLVYWAMLLSASRVSFAAVFISAGLFVVLLRQYKWLAVLLVLGIAGVIFTPQLAGRYRELIINHLNISVVPTVYAAVDEEIPDTLKPPVVAEDRSLNIRLKASWPKAMRAFYKNPLLGTGYSSVGLAVDNDYLRILAETGTLGLLAFILVMVNLYKPMLPLIRKPKLDFANIFPLAVMCALAGLLVNAIFIDVFEASKIAIITWTLLGLVHKSLQLAHE